MRLANRMPYTSGTKAMASVQILKVQHVLALEASDSQHSWQDCRLDISKCSPDQLEMLQGSAFLLRQMKSLQVLEKNCMMRSANSSRKRTGVFSLTPALHTV